MSHKLLLKLFLGNPGALTDAQAVPIFHSWIQTHALADHLLIDVADYAHVHQGPGALLVAHEANIVLDHAQGRSGLIYQRKQPYPGLASFDLALAATFKNALAAAHLLEQGAPGAQFRTDEFQLKIADRLHAPNTPQTFQHLRPQVESFLNHLLGPRAYSLAHNSDPAALFEITIRSQSHQTLGDLLKKLP